MAQHIPRKRFGQHFLTDQALIDAIIDLIAPDEGETARLCQLDDCRAVGQLSPPGSHRIAQRAGDDCPVALAAGCNSVAAVTSWAVPNDLSERYAGTLAGILNTCTNLGGALSPVLTPYIANRYGWIAALDFAAAFMLSVALLWLLVHPERRID